MADSCVDRNHVSFVGIFVHEHYANCALARWKGKAFMLQVTCMTQWMTAKHFCIVARLGCTHSVVQRKCLGGSDDGSNGGSNLLQARLQQLCKGHFGDGKRSGAVAEAAMAASPNAVLQQHTRGDLIHSSTQPVNLQRWYLQRASTMLQQCYRRCDVPI